MKIIYILSGGHSGSTVFGSVLGSLDHAVHIGEFSNFYQVCSGNLETCSCGKSPDRCPFWSKVLKDFIKKNDLKVYEDIRRKIESHLSSEGMQFFQFYSELTKSIFEIILRHSNSEIIIDSSKSLNRAYSLSNVFKQDLQIVYLKRNFNGVTGSYYKKREGKLNINRFVYSLYKEHLRIKLLKRKFLSGFHEFNYEDITSDIKLNALLKSLNIHEEIDISSTFYNRHIIAGNRMRFNPDFSISIKDETYKFNLYQRIVISIFNILRRWI